TLLRTMLAFKENGGLVALHAENGDVIDVLVRQAVAAGKVAPKYHAVTRPPILEAEAVHRAICIAEVAESPVYFVHLSSRQALEELQRGRDRGLPVFAETCPHYLVLDDSRYDLPGVEGAKYVLTPPPRPPEHQEALWRGCARAISRSSRRITAHSALPIRKPWGRTISPKFPTVGQASKTVCP